MRKWEITVEINAPIQVVWDRLTDFDNEAKWNPNVTSSAIRTVKTYGTGTMITVNRGWTHHLLTIKEFQPDTFLSIDFKGDNTTGRSENFLQQNDKATILKHEYFLEIKGLNKYLRIFTRTRLKNEILALKKWIETNRITKVT